MDTGFNLDYVKISSNPTFQRQTSGESASLYFAVTIQTCGLFLDVFLDSRSDERRQLRCAEHPIDNNY
jgi:hypothetical protein